MGEKVFLLLTQLGTWTGGNFVCGIAGFPARVKPPPIASLDPTLRTTVEEDIRDARFQPSPRGMLGVWIAMMSVCYDIRSFLCLDKISFIIYYIFIIVRKTIFIFPILFRGRSSVWLERLPVTQEAEGSSPFAPATSLASDVARQSQVTNRELYDKIRLVIKLILFFYVVFLCFKKYKKW